MMICAICGGPIRRPHERASFGWIGWYHLRAPSPEWESEKKRGYYDHQAVPSVVKTIEASS